MIDFDSLAPKLAANLTGHGARLKFRAHFRTALITTRTVNLAAIASVFAGTAQPAAQDERCRRFLKDCDLPDAERRHFIVALRGVTDAWTLAVDRTNWKFGPMDLHRLVLAIVPQGTAYPVLWFPLEQAGNSHTDERILRPELFLTWLEKEQIATLVADREFSGKDWLEWLTAQHLPLQIRAKANLQAT